MGFNLNWKDKGIYIKYYGYVSITDIQGSNFSMYNDSRFGHTMYQIVDCLEIAETNIQIDEFISVIGYEIGAAYWRKTMKIAIIVKDKDILSLVKAYINELKNTSWTFKIFDTYFDAEIWCKK